VDVTVNKGAGNQRMLEAEKGELKSKELNSTVFVKFISFVVA